MFLQSHMLARVLTHAAVILVSPELGPELPCSMHMKHASALSEAVKMAEMLCGSSTPRIAVIPDGVSVIVSQQQ